MKVKVISVFIDKKTKERYKLNSELNITKERYEEIKDFVEPIKDTKNNSNKETESQNWFSVSLLKKGEW